MRCECSHLAQQPLGVPDARVGHGGGREQPGAPLAVFVPHGIDIGQQPFQIHQQAASLEYNSLSEEIPALALFDG
jgi:hypothetical protein